MAHAVGRRLPTSEDRVRFRVIPCETRGGKSDTGGKFSPQYLGVPRECHFTNTLHTLGIIDQHYSLIMISLFITQAPTCFGTYAHMLSAGQCNARNYNIRCTQFTDIYNT
jgi:hypothetical protein